MARECPITFLRLAAALPIIICEGEGWYYCVKGIRHSPFAVVQSGRFSLHMMAACEVEKSAGCSGGYSLVSSPTIDGEESQPFA